MDNIPSKVIQLKDIVFNVNSQEEETSKESIYISLRKAKQDWENAKNIFENVTNPDLIDYAIYNVDAAEKRYMYLLKQIKSGNV